LFFFKKKKKKKNQKNKKKKKEEEEMKPSKFSKLITLFLLLLFLGHPILVLSHHDYQEALQKSILFFEGQRSGPLPPDQRLRWRADSGLEDGSDRDVDLTGGYYDAGDNVKFNFPMAFTTTMLAWSVVEFGELMPPTQLTHSLVAIKWATDYLLKTIAHPNRIYVQVIVFFKGYYFSGRL